MALRTSRLAPPLRAALRHEWRRLRSDVKEPCPSCPPPPAPPACRSPPAVHPAPAHRVTCCARPQRVDCHTGCSDDKTSIKKVARNKHSVEEQKEQSSPTTKTAAGSTESAASSDCIDHIPDSRCQIRKTGGIDPCAHKPRVILTIDRSEHCKEAKDQNCTSEPASSPKSGKNTLTKSSSERKPKLPAANLQADNITSNSCDTKTCKKTDDQSWCKTVPVPPNSESKQCPPLTLAQKILKARQKLGCIRNKKKYHTSSCLCAKSLDSIMKERSQLKEAGRGREVFPGRSEAEIGQATELLQPGAAALHGAGRFTVEIKLRPPHKSETKTSTCSLTSLESNEKLNGTTHHHSPPGRCQTSISKTCQNPKHSSAQDKTHKQSPNVPRCSWTSYQGIKNCLGFFSNESERLKAPDTQKKSESSKCKAQPAPPGTVLPFPPRSPPYPCGPSATDPPFTAPDACNRENKHRVAPASITLYRETSRDDAQCDTSRDHTQCDTSQNEKSTPALRQAQTNKKTCAWREDCPQPEAKPSAPEGPLCPNKTQIDKFSELSFSERRPFFYFSKRIA